MAIRSKVFIKTRITIYSYLLVYIVDWVITLLNIAHVDSLQSMWQIKTVFLYGAPHKRFCGYSFSGDNAAIKLRQTQANSI